MHHVSVIGSRVLVVTGAPGAGKTAIAAHVAARLPAFVVLDMDVLLEPASRLAGVDLRRSDAASTWPAYNELWVRLAAILARARPVLLLGPLVPDEVEQTPSRWMLAAVEWALLDCSDKTRRERLTERGYDSAAITNAITDAAAARSLGLYVISTDHTAYDRTATKVASWAMHATP
jgi:predicted kinase